jgi:hypothetical protein
MLGPNHHSYHLANQMHEERVRHAARIHEIKRDHLDPERPANRESHRRVTVARLAAAGLASFALSVAIAANAVASSAAAGGSGALTLIR